MAVVKLNIDGVDYNCTPSGVAPPVVPPTPVPPAPPVTPPAVGCGPDEVFGGGSDRDLSPLEQALWPAGQRDLTASGDLGTAIRFVANAAKYPLGMQVHIVDQTNPGVSKQFVVSACPHNFDRPINQYADYLFGVVGTIVLRFGAGSVSNIDQDVPLVAGQTYYLNFREWKAPGDTTPRGTAVTQMWWLHRSDP